MPAVSVVIPAKNEENSIGQCLSSLSAQVDPQDEIIVLDNGSTDDTAAIADKFDNVTVIDAPDSRFTDGDGNGGGGGDAHYRGLSQLRQFGAEQASNEIVATTDADTDPPPDWLDRIKAHFRADDELSVVWGVVTDTNGVPVRNLTGKYLTFLGGVSGANTAFRRADFEQLKQGYTGWPMFEDVALITRLARTGKAVHDTSLRMRSDLDRRRYQTIPMLATSLAGAGTGALIGGPIASLAMAGGTGLAGTELFYEAAPSSPSVHHDQIGLGLILAGATVGGLPGLAAVGGGGGMLAHHVLTEGASAIPTDLMEHTDSVCAIPEDGETPEVVCEPSTDRTPKATRVLAAATAGGVGAKLLFMVFS